jgi:hypothetical protein
LLNYLVKKKKWLHLSLPKSTIETPEYIKGLICKEKTHKLMRKIGFPTQERRRTWQVL